MRMREGEVEVEEARKEEEGKRFLDTQRREWENKGNRGIGEG